MTGEYEVTITESSTLVTLSSLFLTGTPAYMFIGKLGLDVSTAADVVPVDLTGLVWNYEANATYIFKWIGKVLPNATTTGCGFQLNTSTAITDIAMRFTHQLANTGTISGGSSGADDVSIGVSSGMASASVSTIVVGNGLLITGAESGTAQLRFRSETTAITTAKAGLVLTVERII